LGFTIAQSQIEIGLQAKWPCKGVVQAVAFVSALGQSPRQPSSGQFGRQPARERLRLGQIQQNNRVLVHFSAGVQTAMRICVMAVFI